MVDGPRQRRKKQVSYKRFTKSYLPVVLIVAAVVAGFFLATGRQIEPGPKKATHTPVERSVARLYKEAETDLGKKDLKSAASKFKQIANIVPDFKDAGEQAKAIAQTYLERGQKHLANDEYEKAREALDIAQVIDPTNENIVQEQKKLDTGDSNPGGDTGDSNPGGDTGDSNPGGDTGDSDPGGDTGDSDPGGDTGDSNTPLKQIPNNATALSLHRDDVDGYLSIKKAWNIEPFNASSVYLPIASELRSEIDRVIVLIAKHESAQAADVTLQREKDDFGLEKEDITINGHPAYTAMNDFSESELFKMKQIAGLAWTRGEWFFSIHVLPSPKGVPANEYKKGIARDVAKKLGY